MTEMTKLADILSIASSVAFGLSALCLALTVFFWFKYKIPSVINDLSGKTARKSIESMRASNEKSGNKSFKPSYINAQRGKLTDTMTSLKDTTGDIKTPEPAAKPATGGIRKIETPAPETELMQENSVVPAYDVDATELLSEETDILTEETDVLSEETEYLGAEETEYLGATDVEPYIETGLLEENKAVFEEEDDFGETSLLVESNDTEELEETGELPKPAGRKLVMLDDVMEIHTDVTVL